VFVLRQGLDTLTSNTTNIYVGIDIEMKRKILQKTAVPLINNDLARFLGELSVA
jgi:hypothetical protein